MIQKPAEFAPQFQPEAIEQPRDWHDTAAEAGGVILRALEIDTSHLPLKLTKRQQMHLELASQGLSKAEAANKLFLSPDTVQFHRTTLLSKNNQSTMAGAVYAGLINGQIEWQPDESPPEKLTPKELE